MILLANKTISLYRKTKNAWQQNDIFIQGCKNVGWENYFPVQENVKVGWGNDFVEQENGNIGKKNGGYPLKSFICGL
jgi:hypothetical protein